MRTRKPIVADQFYPGQRNSCISEIEECLQARAVGQSLPEKIVAGIVPHAGWFFSGSTAAMVFSAIKQRQKEITTFIIFGAAHGYFGPMAALDDSESWETPLGDAAVDTDLAEQLVNKKLAVKNSSAHRGEHSIEVQVPFIQYLFPNAQILPIIVPPGEKAILLGESIGDIITELGKTIICIGSTDLTHYGPRYGFTPVGIGPDAIRWAGEVNDRKFTDLALKMDPKGMLASAAENCNACGPGAAAATIAAAKRLGKNTGQLLKHTNSNEVMLRKMGRSSTDSVGYAAIIY
ncbi:MAG: AmmeMemoRadiSam system protein B [Planctomycetes bacterium RBG_13_46_10]|nr:MAG: AmmeMemoRadiSam system protein B [Planctomycetes bacterium RBG_13_46_10]